MKKIMFLNFIAIILLLSSCSTDTHVVSFETNGGNVITSVEVESTLSEPEVPVKEGYDFIGWFSDPELNNAYDFTSTVVEDLTLYAKWELTQYTINFNSNGGSTIPSINQVYGTTLNEPTQSEKTGYEFLGWYLDEELTEPFNLTTMPSENLTLYAKWKFTGVRIGVILPDQYELRWNDTFYMFEETLVSLGEGYEYEILFSEGDEQTELDNAQYLIDRGAQVIIFVATGSGNAVVDLVAEEEGVILISHDRLSQSNNASSDYYTSFNAWDIGVAQGQHLVDMANENGCSETNPCDLALFSGRVFDWPMATFFFGGAMEVLVPELDMFNTINIDTEPFYNLVNYYETNGIITETNFDADDAMILLHDAMNTANTDWNPMTASNLATEIINELDTATISDDVYILAPADFISTSIRDVFNGMEGNTYQNMYITGQDAKEIAVASLMGDPINGHGTQTMTVFKDIKKLVEVSVGIAKNIIDGKDGLDGYDYTGQTAGVTTVYAPLDILLLTEPQHTYDLIFATGYYDKNNDIFENIDFSQYEE